MKKNKNNNQKAKIFIDKNSSLISFNKRILERLDKSDFPIFEKLRFCSIIDNNINELASIRLKEDKNLIKSLVSLKNEVDNKFLMYLFNIMKSNNLKLSKTFDKNELKELKSIFENKIKPNFQTIDNTKGINLRAISSGDTFFVARLENKEYIKNVSLEGYDLEDLYFMMENNEDIKPKKSVPEFILNFSRIDNIPRFYTLTTGKIVTLEMIINVLNNHIYKDNKFVDGGICRVIRYDNIEELQLDPEISTKKNLKKVHKRNNRSYPSLIEIDTDIDDKTIKLLAKSFNVKTNVINRFKLVGCSTAFNIDFNNIVNIEDKYFDNQKPFNNYDKDKLLETIKNHDVLLSHPYESYDTVIDFLKEGVNNPNVKSIYQTIYRVSSIDSEIIKLLCEGAKNGKDVNVLVEIKARGNEGMNLHIIDKLTESGVNIIKTYKNIKVHSKALVLKEIEENKINYYTHLGTGNYNEKTSKIYVDYSYFTYNKKLGEEVIQMFNTLDNKKDSKASKGELFNYSVGSVREIVCKELDKLDKALEENKACKCTIKVNGINDFDIVNRIYESARKGVVFDIIVRGECIMCPIDNIKIKSIVGRYLEHSRIYRFEIEGEYDKLYLSTADLMTRNLSRRIESIIEIQDKKIKDEIVSDLATYNYDNRNGFYQMKPGKWKYIDSVYPIDVQKYMYCKNNNKDTH